MPPPVTSSAAMPDHHRSDGISATPQMPRADRGIHPAAKPLILLTRWALYAALTLFLLSATGYSLAPWLVPLRPTLTGGDWH